MALLRRVFPALLLSLTLSLTSLIHAAGGSDGGTEREAEEFSEELLLKPLPDRKVLAHFHFTSVAPPSAANGCHHRLFPKTIAQLVQKFQVRQLELSFTQGRWNYERWGGSDPTSLNNAKPPGVELWALFDHHPKTQIDAAWKNLTHTLSGLFCASINFLESSTAFSTPHWGFHQDNNDNLRYGALPREAVCTENLTPWLKLLPCQDKTGIASLLDRPSIAKGYYHAQRLHLSSSESSGIILEQTLTIVLQPNVHESSQLQPSWSLSHLFKKTVTGKCVLSKSSRIFFEFDRGLVAELDKTVPEVSWGDPVFQLFTIPDRKIKDQSGSSLYEYNIRNYSNMDGSFNVGMTWKLPFVWASSSDAPFHSNRFLMGSGNERGSLAISLQSTKLLREQFSASSSRECSVQVVVFQVVPWYVKVYYHTLQVFIDGKKIKNVSDVIEKIRVTPSEDKLLPGTLEMMLRFPCNVVSATLALDFDKGFLHIDEYPPDANQGFDIPSALVSFPDFDSSRIYAVDDSAYHSPLLQSFKERRLVKSYTEVLLVPLTTPDFSMPYNVITFTCTVLALYFGSLLNVLRRRIGEEERLLKSKGATEVGFIPLMISRLSSTLRRRKHEFSSESSARSPPSSSVPGSKLLYKVISVAVIAVVWHYYFS